MGAAAGCAARLLALHTGGSPAHALPIFHTHGLFVATITVLASGASMIFLPKFDACEVMRAMLRATVTMDVGLSHPNARWQIGSSEVVRRRLGCITTAARRRGLSHNRLAAVFAL